MGQLLYYTFARIKYTSMEYFHSLILSVRFKNLGFSHVGILSWGNLRTPNSYIDFSVGSGGNFEFRGLLHVLSVIGGMRLRASQLARSSAPWH